AARQVVDVESAVEVGFLDGQEVARRGLAEVGAEVDAPGGVGRFGRIFAAGAVRGREDDVRRDHFTGADGAALLAGNRLEQQYDRGIADVDLATDDAFLHRVHGRHAAGTAGGDNRQEQGGSHART